MNFNEYYWHDSVITNLTIDRTNPGISDTISLEIILQEGGDIELIFEDVYWANLALNFGIRAKENILHAFMAEKNDEDLTNLYLRWKGYIDNIDLTCYVFDLNSTGGKIKIIAKGFKVRYS